jgi:hypothetical protein
MNTLVKFSSHHTGSLFDMVNGELVNACMTIAASRRRGQKTGGGHATGIARPAPRHPEKQIARRIHRCGTRVACGLLRNRPEREA